MNIREALIPVGSPVGRGGQPLEPQGLVLHATADYEATAQDIRDYWARLRSPNRANAHLIADWTEVVECVPWEPGKCEKAWHAGEPANSRFIGIELCQSRDKAKADAAYRNWVAAAATVLRAYGWPADRDHVWTHRRVSQELGGTTHTDPDGYLAEIGKSVDQAIDDIGEALKAMAQPQQPQPTAGLTPILHGPTATLEQARAWWQAKCAQGFEDMPERVWHIAPLYGIDPAFTLSQIAHETGFCKFGGDVKPEQNNFGGIGATGGVPGASFPDRDTGVHAVCQHEYAYACDRPLPPWAAKVDPRFDLVKRASSPYVEWLGHADNPNGAGWAWPGQGYGAAIVRLMREMAAVQAPSPVDVAAIRAQAIADVRAAVERALQGVT
ncbi:MAG: N-acetylmuramoyl-L-alanine amidase [Sphaerobacter sp.]|nr:N-acetylmuramoyl-L-alanine amidase [Sphaerobacter sp.]